LFETVPGEAPAGTNERSQRFGDPYELADGTTPPPKIVFRVDRKRDPCEGGSLFDGEKVLVYPIAHLRPGFTPRKPDIKADVNTLTGWDRYFESPRRGIEVTLIERQLVTREIQYRPTGTSQRVPALDPHLNRRFLEQEALATRLGGRPRGEQWQRDNEQQDRRSNSTPVTDHERPPGYAQVPTPSSRD
jgi:hypothetical protein